MKRIHYLFMLSFVVLALAGCSSESASTNSDDSAAESEVRENPRSNNDAKINWVSIEEAEKLAGQDGKKVLVDLYTSWCGWCKRMDKNTFAHPTIAGYVNDNFHAVKFDAESKDVIEFKGETHNFKATGRRGYNELAFKFANGRMSYPTIAFLDEDLNNINAFPGYKDPNKFDPLLKYIGEDHYKSQTLAQFTADYKSSIPPAPAKPRNVTGSKSGMQKEIRVQKN